MNKNLEILNILKQNSRATLTEISKKLDLPISYIFKKIKFFELEGIIKKFTIEVDLDKLKGVK